MSVAREICFSVIGIILFSSVAEIVLPDGNMKKYTSVLLGILAACALFSAVPQIGDIKSGIGKIKIDNSEAAWTDIQDEKIREEYKNNVKKLVEQHGGSVRRIEIDEGMNVTQIVLEGGCDIELKKYLTNEMGVAEDAIKNQ